MNELVIMMTGEEARDWKSRVSNSANELRLLIYEGYSRKAWAALGYKNWTECVGALADEFGISERHIWRLQAANDIENLLTPGSVNQIPEKQLRPLAQLPAEEQAIVWQQAIDTAPDGEITAEHIENTVHEFNRQQIIEANRQGASIEVPPTLEEIRGNGREMKPKINRTGDIYIPAGYDACQTPTYAIDPLLPFLPGDWTIWEPACGENFLVDAFYDASRKVISGDILTGQNFFEYQPDEWDCQVTNPPYSIKYDWLARSYEFQKPFALLLPVETLGAKTAQVLFSEHGLEVIFLDKRINFKMPNKGWGGSGAQFPVAWFTWKFNLGAQMVFAHIEYADAEQE